MTPASTITTDRARALSGALVASGVRLVGNHAEELDFKVYAVGFHHRTVLEVRPALLAGLKTALHDQC